MKDKSIRYRIGFTKAYPPYNPTDKWTVEHKVSSLAGLPISIIDFESQNKQDCEDWIKNNTKKIK